MRRMLSAVGLTTVFMLLAGTLQAQDMLDKLAKDMCPCMEGISETMPKDSVTLKMGICMLTASMPYEKELRKKHGIDLAKIDGESGERLGQLVAVRLMTTCPDFASLAIKLAEDEAPPPPPSGPPVRIVQGTVQDVTPSQFLTITVRTDAGPSYEFLLLDHVTNAEQVSQEPGKAKGFFAKWGYEEREFFDPYTRTYKTYRVLRSIEP